MYVKTARETNKQTKNQISAHKWYFALVCLTSEYGIKGGIATTYYMPLVPSVTKCGHLFSSIPHLEAVRNAAS